MPDEIRDLLDLGLRCPRCHGELVAEVRDGEGTLRCSGCDRTYPVLLGIPDLRVFADPYIGIEEDRAKGRRLASAGGRTWEDLARAYYAMTRDTVPERQASLFAAGLHAARARAAADLAAWDALAGPPSPTPAPPARCLLDLGCGTAPLLVAAAGRTDVRVGVDIAFRWLVVAQQRLRDAGVRAHLVCACAEALPFAGERFDLVATQGTLEHLQDQSRGVVEAHRVLRSGGQIRVRTANRWNLGPDPHFGIPAGGLLPAALTAWWARRHGALPPQRRLLTAAGLAALLRRGGFGAVRMSVPTVGEEELRDRGPAVRALGRVYTVARTSTLLRRLLLLAGPALLAAARKPDAAGAD